MLPSYPEAVVQTVLVLEEEILHQENLNDSITFTNIDWTWGVPWYTDIHNN